ncbi:MAG TPA: PqqD family protein [Candidatus Omnitrophota bacterium]|nr:PqqD family protein [Candidatus Omnitrophota bacterium]
MQINSQFVLREEGDEGFLFDVERGRILILNETGIFAWKLCQQGYAEKEIADRVAEEFEVSSAADIGKDVRIFLERLKTYNCFSA